MKLSCLLAVMISLSACVLPSKQELATGKQLSFQRNKGNCLACHVIEDGIDPGNIGPALIEIPQKFASKSALKAVIWDASAFNSQTSMPPFGRNKILTSEELDLVVNYIWSLSGAVQPVSKEW
ncbi:MAG: sulfur oxidation c-type cytochrome SoxX [Methyloprofundus sp.]|nr:sulfur oxidation c-type cytochrome SoxX [Methyloprofundus sp.]